MIKTEDLLTPKWWESPEDGSKCYSPEFTDLGKKLYSIAVCYDFSKMSFYKRTDYKGHVVEWTVIIRYPEPDFYKAEVRRKWSYSFWWFITLVKNKTK